MQGSLLITGATGGLGIALVAAARAKGMAVKATGRSVRNKARIEALGATFVQVDLFEAGAIASLLEGQNGIIHAAALSSSWAPQSEFQAANIVVTQNLLAAAQEQGIERFVFVSSPSIFAALRDRFSLQDNDAPHDPPLNMYAQTKLIGERMVLAASRPGFATTAIRPRALVGPDDRVLLPRLIALARRKVMPLPRGGKALIELTDVRDGANAILAAYDNAEAISGRAFNISGGQPLAVSTIARALAETLGLSPILVHLPIAIALPMAMIGETLAKLRSLAAEPVLTRYTLATLAYAQTFDLAEAQKALQWQPSYDAFETLLDQAKRMQQ